MLELKNQITEALDFIRTKTKMLPEVGIILGTGLGALAKEIDSEIIIDYKDIPHFPLSTVESHEGKLIFGKLGGKNVVAMQGRFHYYEGYTMKQITFPVRVMKALGIKVLCVSNIAGGMNPNYRRGDIMIINDHINMLGDNPLIGRNDDDLGPRFPDMSEPYNKELIRLAEQIAMEERIKVHAGVYLAVPGPNLETRAEYRMFRNFGADVVGMSTVPEVIVAIHSGLKVFGMTVISDECFPDFLQPVSVDEIIKAAMEAEPKLTLIMKKLIERITI
ncbi:MAG TPA: purine-nucleoside phosphorylase [Bacteroidota bacterium]|nr:purine-nucleoside phosphorylase [Bacteroidota bacterium]